MNAIICELCGSNDLIKQNGYFVCQHCGTKYSTEEAKKLIFQGTVKVDNSERLENLYTIARRAKEDNNSESAEKYYDMILVEDPMSWEATFYVVYFRAMRSKIMDIQSAANSITNCLPTVIDLIDSNVNSQTEKKAAVSEIMSRVLYISNLLQEVANKHFNEIDYKIKEKYRSEAINRNSAAVNTVYTFGNCVEKKWSNTSEFCKFATSAWKTGIQLHHVLMSILPFSDRMEAQNIIKTYEEKIRRYEPEYGEQDRIEEERRKERYQQRIDTIKTAVKKRKKLIASLMIIAAICVVFVLYKSNAPYREIAKAIESKTLTYSMCSYGIEDSYFDYLYSKKGQKILASTLSKYHKNDDVDSALWLLCTQVSWMFDGGYDTIAASSSFVDWIVDYARENATNVRTADDGDITYVVGMYEVTISCAFDTYYACHDFKLSNGQNHVYVNLRTGSNGPTIQ